MRVSLPANLATMSARALRQMRSGLVYSRTARGTTNALIIDIDHAIARIDAVLAR